MYHEQMDWTVRLFQEIRDRIHQQGIIRPTGSLKFVIKKK